MTGEPLSKFGKDFQNRLERNLPEGIKLEDLHICPSGLVAHIQGGVITPLGCPSCIGVVIHHDKNGHPMLADRKLVAAEDLGYSGAEHGYEIVSNLWFCPQCKVPVSSLLPKFDAKASDIG